MFFQSEHNINSTDLDGQTSHWVKNTTKTFGWAKFYTTWSWWISVELYTTSYCWYILHTLCSYVSSASFSIKVFSPNKFLWVLIFQKEQIYISTFYLIPPHWHDTGSWNPSSIESRIYLFLLVNIMGADVLVTQGARTSATMIFTLLNWINSVPAC